MKKGFTLAEVLVTLAIIGVIAAMAVPTLLQSTNQAELKTALKQNYALLSQAYNSLLNDPSSPFTGGDASGQFPAVSDLKAAFQTKLNYVKDCSVSATFTGNCWSNEWFTGTAVPANRRANLAPGGAAPVGVSAGLTGSGTAIQGFALANGAFVAFDAGYDVNFASTVTGFIPAPPSADAGAVLYVDINGTKGPNRTGKDIFAFVAKKRTIAPYNNSTSDCTTTGIGWTCSAENLFNQK